MVRSKAAVPQPNDSGLGYHDSTADSLERVQNQKLRKDVAPLFKDDDVFLILDGRSDNNTVAINTHLRKTLKGRDNIAKRQFTVIRRAYTNQEFQADGYAAPRRRRSLNPKVPDPLENCFLVVSKSFRLPRRSSAMSSITHDNYARGWSGLRMKTSEEQQYGYVTVETYEQMASAGRSEAKVEDISGVLSSEEEREEPADDATKAPACVMVAPWESAEYDYQLLVELYGQEMDMKKIRVVGLEAGAGALALSCLRRKQHVTMFADNQTHKDVLWQTCCLKIVSEICLGKAGFQMNRRMLSREGSLTGQDQRVPAPSVPTPEQPQVATATEGVSEQDAVNVDGDSDSSSSSA